MKNAMNTVEVNLNNNGNNNHNMNSNIDYQEINTFNSNKETDNSGDGLSNNQEEGEVEEEKEPEEEELSNAEIEHLRKIHEQTMLRSEKYANIYSPQNTEKKSTSDKNSNEKLDTPNTTTTEDISNNPIHNILEIFNENDNVNFNEQKINPNKERIFTNIHCFFYLDNEPLVIIGPDLTYFILIFTMVSFLSILIYSLKSTGYFTSFLFVIGYLFFSICYILMMVVNPGIPSEKNNYDINDLNINYRQCKICNCIYHKDDFKNVVHCNKCGICVEGCEQHCNFATKCIGKKNKIIYKAWIISIISLISIMFIYLIF